MQRLIMALSWRLGIVLGYPLVLAMRRSWAATISNDMFEQLAQTHSTSMLIGACAAFWLIGAVVGTYYPTPDDMKSTEISLWLKFLICITGGLAAFMWSVHSDGNINLLTPLWVGGVAFVSPHLIQVIPSIIKTKLGLGSGKSSGNKGGGL